MSKTFTYALMVIGVYILIIATGGKKTDSQNSDSSQETKKKEKVIDTIEDIADTVETIGGQTYTI